MIAKLIRLAKYQEAEISTEDYRPEFEFDRPLQLGLLDIQKYREERHRRVRELKTVELSMDEYMDLRKKLTEMQNQNSLLSTQVQLLKSSVMRDIGNVDDVHRQLHKEKLQLALHRRSFSNDPSLQKSANKKEVLENSLLNRRQELIEILTSVVIYQCLFIFRKMFPYRNQKRY